jgi:histidyl-tRNA synthetase
MSEKKSIYKPRPVSGFPEWLPEVRLVEQQWLDHIRKVFESYGYGSIETPAIEELNVIQAKGGDGGADVDKEVYVIERLHKEEGDKEARLALHFDQTVPLARYVAQHFNELIFPFKRYQMQKVWRGERPQAGRFREFYQCDIDVINPENLPLHFDAEMPAIIWEILAALPGMENERVQLRISNRKILQGFLQSQGINDLKLSGMLTQALDKLDKMHSDAVYKIIIDRWAEGNWDNKILTDTIPKVIGTFKAFTSKKFSTSEEFLHELNVTNKAYEEINDNALFKEGVGDLCFVLDQLKHLPEGSIVADLSIVRGLDYYTGTVYETVFLDDPGYGSICSGGRYDDLAGNYINKHLPGVGISIGFSRLFDRLRQQNKLPVGKFSPTDVLVILMDENERAAAAKKAKELRDKGFNVELYHSAAKIKKQFEYAEKKGIPFVFAPKDGAPGVWEVKNMKTREQKPESDWLKDAA